MTPSSVSTGRTSFSGSARAGSSPGGSARRRAGRRATRRRAGSAASPITNSGSEITASEVTEIAWSAGRPARRAAQTPNTIDSGTITDRAISGEDERVAQLLVDVVPDRQLAALRVAGGGVAEVPRQRARRASRSSARRRAGRAPSARVPRPGSPSVALRPSTAPAASPGSTSVPRKTRIETTSSVRIAAPSLRSRNEASGCSCANAGSPRRERSAAMVCSRVPRGRRSYPAGVGGPRRGPGAPTRVIGPASRRRPAARTVDVLGGGREEEGHGPCDLLVLGPPAQRDPARDRCVAAGVGAQRGGLLVGDISRRDRVDPDPERAPTR